MKELDIYLIEYLIERPQKAPRRSYRKVKANSPKDAENRLAAFWEKKDPEVGLTIIRFYDYDPVTNMAR